MPDLNSTSPEATYATKGNIVPQKAYVGESRTAADIADGPGLPNAEGTVEDHMVFYPYRSVSGTDPTIAAGTFSVGASA